MASSGITRLGGRPVAHHSIPDNVEAEYDRLRDLARQEAKLRNSCFESSQEAYQKQEGARAKKLSDQGKSHAAKMRDYNRQASEYIFRENNAQGRVESDCIDLHGQFVEEAEEILEKRIRADIAARQTHLHAIVGKGNHSSGHVQKLKPKVEELCDEMGLYYETEENDGRIYINLTGGRGRHDAGRPDAGRPDTQKPPKQGRPEHRPEHGRPPKEEEQGLLGFLFDKCCLVM